MSLDKLAVLQEMYDSCLQDRNDINKKIANNNEKLNEIDAYLQSVRDEIESDFKVFSPRSAEVIYKEKLQEKNLEKEAIENDNQIHYRKLSQVDKQIEKIQLLLEDQNPGIENHDIPCSDITDKGNDLFSLKALELQEKEHQRIARELHDSTVQNLTHLVHTIELSSLFIDQDPIRAKLELESSIKNLKQTIQEIRDTIFDLRPMSFDDLGFKKCLEELISNICVQFPGCEIIYDICEITYSELAENETEKASIFLLTIYRIIQEALINSLKHSQADKINIVISKKDGICFINISDNGKGFSLEQCDEQGITKHFGISIMRERVDLLGGKISINTELDKGTEIEIEISIS